MRNNLLQRLALVSDTGTENGMNVMEVSLAVAGMSLYGRIREIVQKNEVRDKLLSSVDQAKALQNGL